MWELEVEFYAPDYADCGEYGRYYFENYEVGLEVGHTIATKTYTVAKDGTILFIGHGITATYSKIEEHLTGKSAASEILAEPYMVGRKNKSALALKELCDATV